MGRSEETANGDLTQDDNLIITHDYRSDNGRINGRIDGKDSYREGIRDILVLSTLPKTWIFDLDGTLLKHNGYKDDGYDTLLPGAKEYVDGIPSEDYILILTSRTDEYKEMTLEFLKQNGIRYNEILFNMPMGERIVVNDRKPSGLEMSVGVNVERNESTFPKVERKL